MVDIDCRCKCKKEKNSCKTTRNAEKLNMTTLVYKKKIEYAKNFLSSFTFKIWKNRFDAYGVFIIIFKYIHNDKFNNTYTCIEYIHYPYLIITYN